MKKLPKEPGSILRHKSGAIAVLLDSGEWIHGDEDGWFLMTPRQFYESDPDLEGWKKTTPFKLSLATDFPWRH